MSPAPGACRIRAERGVVPHFFVQAREAEPLRLSYRGAFEVHPRSDSRLADVIVTAPVAFRGALQLEELGMARRVEVNWALRAGTKARFAPSRIEGPSFRGTLALGEVSVDDVAIPCTALALVPDDQDDPLPVKSGRRVRPSSDTIALHASPGSTERVDASGLVVFSVVRTQGKWTRVSATFDDGSSLAGWAENDALEPVPPGEEADPGEGVALCGAGCLGLGAGPYQRGQALVPAGAAIHASPGGGVWARVTEPVTVEALRDSKGADWIRLLALPGMEEDGCSVVRHAYTPAAGVRFVQGD